MLGSRARKNSVMAIQKTRPPGPCLVPREPHGSHIRTHRKLLAPHLSPIHSTLGLSLCEALGVRRGGPTVPPGLQQDVTGQQDRAGEEGLPGAEAGTQRAGRVRGGRNVGSAPAVRGSARSRP